LPEALAQVYPVSSAVNPSVDRATAPIAATRVVLDECFRQRHGQTPLERDARMRGTIRRPNSLEN